MRRRASTPCRCSSTTANSRRRDRTINEPVQFLVGRNRVRYEVVINWVQKDRAGGYLSIPKDKNLSAEHAAAPTK